MRSKFRAAATDDGPSQTVTTRRSVLAAGVAALCGIGGLGVVACTSEVKEPGELVVGVDTNVALPGKADGFVLTITRRGIVEFATTQTVGQPLPKVLLPATVGVVNGAETTDPVTVRMMATENGTVVGLREAVLTVPTNRVALLQLTVDGFCLGDASVVSTVTSESALSGEVPANACDAGLTCVLGSCQSSDVDAAGLPDFVASSAFGTGDAGTCFDSDTCFHDPATARYRGFEAISADDAGCTVPLPSGATAAQINVGIPADPSACEYDASPCVIPLVEQTPDQAPQIGFQVDVVGGRILLPPGICAQSPPSSGVREALVATAFLADVPATPLCGSWSRVTTTTSEPGTGVVIGDAGLDATVSPDVDGGSDAGDGGAGDASDADAGDAGPYVWTTADSGTPVTFAAFEAGANLGTLTAAKGNQVFWWNDAGVQSNTVPVTDMVATAPTQCATGLIGGVAVDGFSVYMAKSDPAGANESVVAQAAFGSCSSGTTIGLGTTKKVNALTQGNSQLYVSAGSTLYACNLSNAACTTRANAVNDQVTLLAPGPAGVFFTGSGPSASPGGYFVPDSLTAQRSFLQMSGAIELAAAGPTFGTVFFNIDADSQTPILERATYVDGNGAITPVSEMLSPSVDHIAASSTGVVFADSATGIYGCTLDGDCTDATSHLIVSTPGVTALAMSDSFLFWAVGTQVYALPLPTPLVASP